MDSDLVVVVIFVLSFLLVAGSAIANNKIENDFKEYNHNGSDYTVKKGKITRHKSWYELTK
jgi:hypothetical protein